MVLAMFSIHYRTEFGRAIYMVGEGNSLGDWNLQQAIRLLWSEGDIWHIDVDICEQQTKYKYLVASYDDPCQNFLWEEGSNRVYDQICINFSPKEVVDRWNYRDIKFIFKMTAKIKSIYLSGSTEMLGQFQNYLHLQSNTYQFMYNFYINVYENQDVYYKYIFESNGNQQCITKRFNISSISTNFYEENTQIIYHEECKKRKLYKFDNNIFYGGIPRTSSDFDFIKTSHLQTVIEFVYEDNSEAIPFRRIINDMNYIRINLLALKYKHCADFWEYLYNLMKNLVSKFDTFFVCNNSLKYLRRYLIHYKQLERLPSMQGKIILKTLSFSLTS